VTSLGQIEALQAELNHYRDSAALLRAQLYRRGIAATQQLRHLQRRRDSAQRRLYEARRRPDPARARRA
jgi:hypothetical protein